ncbi:DUF1361 domain-containing protein [Bacillus sp. NPDC077411]
MKKIILSSIEIFIGRFLRFYFIHLFTEPFSVVIQLLRSIK